MELSLKDLVEFTKGVAGSGDNTATGHPVLQTGHTFLIRTCTNYWVGAVKDVAGGFVVLVDASETKDAGRLSVTITDGLEGQDCTQIEYVGDAMIAFGAIVDVMPYRHSLPTVSK